MNDRAASVRIAWGLAAIAFTLLLLPLAINLLRGGAGGVGVDPRVQGTGMVFAITFADVGTEGPLNGRIYLAVSRSAQPEPRFQAAGAATGTPGAFLFSRAVVGWRARRAVELTDSDVGAPLPSIAHIPAGYYWVQAVLDRQGNGGADDVGSPADSGSPLAGDWNRRPGNLVSRPVEVFIDPRSDDVIRVHLARTITPTGSAEPPPP
jgi:hypothetical protein